jgi:hypothetical protein
MLEYLIERTPLIADCVELVNTADHQGMTPLFKVWNSLEPTRILLEAGARVNCTAPEGYTPLMHAAWYGGFEVAKELLFWGADYRMLHANGQSALDMAHMNNKEEIARFLEAWPATRLVCVLRSAAVVPRIAKNAPELRILPEAHLRMLKAFLGD